MICFSSSSLPTFLWLNSGSKYLKTKLKNCTICTERGVFGRANPYAQNSKQASEKLKRNRHTSIKLIEVKCDQFKYSQRWFYYTLPVTN
jgi:hypothetical protein